MIYLGIKALRSNGVTFDKFKKNGSKTTAWKAFKQGALIDILNPKVAIFFRNNRHCAVWLDRILGTVLVGLGIRLALIEK